MKSKASGIMYKKNGLWRLKSAPHTKGNIKSSGIHYLIINNIHLWQRIKITNTLLKCNWYPFDIHCSLR